jgi:hypothetical protein
VNSEKIESFITDYVSRIAIDDQFIENLAFRMVHNLDQRDGVELNGPDQKISLPESSRY